MSGPLDLTGQVAVVTGGGTGIGAATTRLLAAHGATVVISGRKAENLERVRAELGDQVLTVPGDVRDAASCRALVELTVGEFGRLDMLVNNAGGAYMFPFLETPVERFDNGIALNLRGPYVLTQAAGR
ncbi:MAG: oxidoreductase, partial [Frankiales bacterium]|nr:oxidoreductase [Frankiales bacterium]